jgi:hypothetical protein
MLLNVSPEELVALKAAMDLALKAASGYSVRTCPSRDVVSDHWKEFTRLHCRINVLEAQRELHMGHPAAKGRKYIHVSVDEAVHDRLQSYLLHRGGGVIRTGVLGEVVTRAIEQYLNAHPIVLNYPEHDADAA